MGRPATRRRRAQPEVRPPTADPNPLLTAFDVASYLGTDAGWVVRHLRALAYDPFGPTRRGAVEECAQTWRFRRADLLSWLEARRVEAAA